MTTNHTATPARSATASRTTYQQARSQYEADPTNPNAIRALGWVYADLLKDASGSADTARMLRGLAIVADFPLATDTRWCESVGWSVCRFLLRHKPDTLPLGPLAEVISRAGAFIPAQPGLLRSVWWKALLRHEATGLAWVDLFDRHGWDGGFRPDDEQPDTYTVAGSDEPRSVRPLVEGLIQAVAKQLLAGVTLPDELAEPWLARLTDLSARHPDWNYLPYYHAQLLIRLDRRDEAMRVFMPFARLKKRDFWVWSLLAELVAPEQVPACLARALTLGTPEAFLVKVRQRTAGWLITQHRWADARAEIERLVQTRQASQWPIPAEVQQWMNGDLYTQAETVALGHWYGALLPEANALLWTDCPETVALVTGVDPTGKYANVAIDAKTAGSFPVAALGIRPRVGDCLTIRYTMTQRKGRPQLVVQTAKPTDAPPTHLEIRHVRGPLRQVAGKTIAFVGQVYVPADLLAASAALVDTLVSVEAVASWDAVKQQVGWRAFRIQKDSVNLS